MLERINLSVEIGHILHTIELDGDEWKKKYPYWKGKQEITDGCDWTLKLRDRKGRAKYCSGYESFPRRYKELIEDFNSLFSSEINF